MTDQRSTQWLSRSALVLAVGLLLPSAALAAPQFLSITPPSGTLTNETQVTLSGSVFHELMHYLELDSEILVANMAAGDVTFRFDALSYRVSNLKVETSKHEHWTELLDERLEKIAAVFELLDRKFFELGTDMSF